MKLLRKMNSKDIDTVVSLIDSHDEDDAEEAEHGYRRAGGIYDQFVLEQNGEVIGVSGFVTPPNCDDTHWLSWTYVHADHANQGHGRKMLNELIEELKSRDARKVFIKVSDYESEEDGAIYAAALHLYQSLGFEIEIKLADYYDEGESQYILGMRLQPDSEPTVEDEIWPIQFNSVYEIAETDDAYSFGWHDQGEQLFTDDDIRIGLDSVREEGGRCVFLSFPGNYPEVHQQLLTSGFSFTGAVDDYYADGVHEHHYVFKL